MAQLTSWFLDFRWKEVAQMMWALLTGEDCAICGTPLWGNGLCAKCWFKLPYTHLKGRTGNLLERLFWGEENVERVTAHLWYKPEYEVSHAIHAFKYHGRTQLARSFGRAMATELRSTDFFDGVAGIIPVPLSRQRLAKRGYNQSEWLAKGVADITGLPIMSHLLTRCVDNPSQTTLSPSERKENVAGIFSVPHPEQLDNKRWLIIDDVLTIGATLTSLARTIGAVSNARLRMLTLCAAGHYHIGRLSAEELGLPDVTAVFNPNELRAYRPSSPPMSSPPSGTASQLLTEDTDKAAHAEMSHPEIPQQS